MKKKMNPKKAEEIVKNLVLLDKKLSKIDENYKIHNTLYKILERYKLTKDSNIRMIIVSYFKAIFHYNMGRSKIILYTDHTNHREISIGRAGFRIKRYKYENKIESFVDIMKLVKLYDVIIDNLILNGKHKEAEKFKKFVKIISTTNIGSFEIPLKKKIKLLYILNAHVVNFFRISITSLTFINNIGELRIYGVLDEKSKINQKLPIKIETIEMKNFNCKSVENILNNILLKNQMKDIEEKFEKIIKHKSKINKIMKDALNKEFSKEMMVANL